MNTIKFDKEAKCLILVALQRGCFTKSDIKALREKKIIPVSVIEVNNEQTKRNLESIFERLENNDKQSNTK